MFARADEEYVSPRVLRNTSYCSRLSFSLACPRCRPFLVRDSETYICGAGFKWNTFPRVLLHSNCSSIGSPSCATWLRVRERIKDQDRRSTSMCADMSVMHVRLYVCVGFIHGSCLDEQRARARAHTRESTSQLCWL